MRLAVAVVVLVAVSASGCFGGCYTSSYALAWEDTAVADALRARSEWDGTVTANEVGPGLPVDPALLPVRDGNAALATVILSWPAETPEMDVSELRLRTDRDGNGSVIWGLVDAHLGSARFGGHVDTFLAAVLADPADAAAIKTALLADYNPGRYDFSDGVTLAVDAPLALDALVASGDAAWAPDRVGMWSRADGDWRFEAAVESWRWFLTEDRRSELAADAAGHVQGPALPATGEQKAPARADVEAATSGMLDVLGLPPAPGEARFVGAGRTCVD